MLFSFCVFPVAIIFLNNGFCRQKIKKRYGVIECDPLIRSGLDKSVS